MSEDIYIDEDDTLETSHDSILDNLTDEQYVDYITNGNLPTGVTLPSSSDESDSEADKPASDDAHDKEEKDTEDKEDSDTTDESNSDDDKSTSDDADTEVDDADKEPQEAEVDESSESFKKLFSKPIKANGTEFTLESFDEAISLIQKGAGYEAKMKKLKPSMKIIKSLEDNNISESEVNFLIDIHKGNKNAIKELLEKNKIDALEIEETTDKYIPGKNIVSDEVMKLADSIDAIKSSEFSEDISKVLTETWDEESKNFIASRPETLLELLGEFKLGRFDMIQSIVARENALGKNNKPDIVRYGELAKMYEEGEIKLPTPTKPKVSKETKERAKPAPKSTPPKSVQKKTPADYSDAELEKLSDEEYMNLFGK